MAKTLGQSWQIQAQAENERRRRAGLGTIAKYLDWRSFLTSTFLKLSLKPFANHQIELWDWAWTITAERPRPFVALFARGAAKSTSAELVSAMVGITRKRPYIVYVSGTQDLADKHVQSIGALLEAAGITRSVNRYGSSRGWRRDRLRTDTFTIDSLGLDTAARGIRVDDARPGLIVLDDVDSLHDTADTVRKKTETLTETILPSGANNCAVLFVQNLMHRDSIASKIADGRADFLSDRIVSGPHPALLNFSYEIIDGILKVNGLATWDGQSLEDCKAFIKSWGLRAFLRECQHQVNEAENGIWNRESIEKNRVIQHPALIKIAVGVDPPGGLRTECGIVTNGIDAGGHLYTLDDSSLAGTPDVWGRAVVTAYYRLDADIVVAEQNFGGEMVLSTIHNADPRVPVKMVTASRGKTPRAEPIALLCQEGKEHHVGTFTLLEAEQCSWVPDSGMPSPNRMDAMVFSCIELTPRQGTWVPKAKSK